MSNRIFGLDLTRTIAILLVVIAHLSIPIFNKSSKFIEINGLLGVEIFFILSGFLIGGMLIRIYNEKDKFRFKEAKGFLIRRWFRTLPNYYLILILLLLVYPLLLHSGESNMTSVNFFKFFTFLQYTIFPTVSYFMVSWSLCIEEWFYLTFSLSLALISKLKRTKPQTLLILIGFYILLSFVLRFLFSYNYNIQWGIIRLFTWLRLDSIVIGVLGAFCFYYMRDKWERQKNKLFILGMILFIISIIYISIYLWNTNRAIDFFNKTFYFTILDFSILLCIPFLNSIGEFKFNWLNKFISHTSKVSYSMYLINYYIVIWLINFKWSAFMTILVSIALTYTISSIQYKYFEKPIMELRDKFT